MLSAGTKIPAANVKLIKNHIVSDVDAKDYLASGTTIIFTLPGAFTPTCSNDHLPGYVELYDELLASGADRVTCATVNDFHVTLAWAIERGAVEKIEFLADAHAHLAKAMKLDVDMADLGVRFQRAALIVKDGTVTNSFLAGERGTLGDTSAQSVLAALRSQS